MTKMAIIQEAPAFLDRNKSISGAVELVHEAARNGAGLALFPEAFISGYPAWIWRLKPGGDWGLGEALYARFLENAVNLDRGDLKPLQEAAKDAGIIVVCGLTEKDGGNSRSTLYNTVITIDNDGRIINHHRKLMPTNPERMVWGFGDGSGLNVLETDAGRIGSLICWENFMPLARYALYAQGVEVYLAPTYDSGSGWIGSMQHIAREGRCWVLSCGVALHETDIPADFPERERLYPQGEAWINPGDSVVVAPGGDIVAGPMNREKGILYWDVDAALAANAKRALDVAGHYSRPDVFSLSVNRQPQAPVTFR